jgi:hypothetical protein
MTKTQKILVKHLLNGHYLRKWVNVNRTRCYRLYDASCNPVSNHGEKTVNGIDRRLPYKLFKSHKGKLSLNLSHVRQLHGRTWIKREYKKSKLNV